MTPLLKVNRIIAPHHCVEHSRGRILTSATHTHAYIHICSFNFDALAQGNAYKPTKEPINYRGPGGDRTHDLQTEATPPAASCPARTHTSLISPLSLDMAFSKPVLWHHAKIRQWHSDTIFWHYSCTNQLAQGWCSQENITCEYRSLATGYSL